MLIGNKLDLVEEDPQKRKINKNEVETFAKKNDLLYEETSAKSGLNVKESFEKLVQSNKNF